MVSPIYPWKLQNISFDEEVWEINLWSNSPAKRRLLFLSKIYNEHNSYPILIHNDRINPHTIEVITSSLGKLENSNKTNSIFSLYDMWAGNYHTAYFLDGKFVEGITPCKDVNSMEDFKYGLNQYFCMFIGNFAEETLGSLITNSNLPQTHIDAVSDLWK